MDDLARLKEHLLKNERFREIYHDKTDLAFEISDMIFKIRLKHGLTQGQLAKKLDTKQSSISRLEAGEALPSLSFLERIAKVFNKKLLPPRFVEIKVPAMSKK